MKTKKEKKLSNKGHGKTNRRIATESHDPRNDGIYFNVRTKGGKVKVRCTEEEREAFKAKAEAEHRKMSSYFHFKGIPFIKWNSVQLRLEIISIHDKNGMPKYPDGISDYCRAEILGLDNSK